MRRPEIRADNGRCSVPQEFRQTLKENGYSKQRIRSYSPEKNGLKEQWCIPPEANTEFVEAMEDVLDVYHRPNDESQ